MSELKVITINLPNKYFEAIKELANRGVFPSRSEAVRTALRDFLSKEFEFCGELEINTFGETVKEGKINDNE